MNCKKCGEEIKDGSLFCNKCGNKIDEPINDKVTKRKINKKLVLGIIIVVVISIGTTIILSNKFNKSKVVQGNTTGNIINDGMATIQGDWIYYEKKGDIYKSKTDGTQNAEISDKCGASLLNVVGDWIYYEKGNSNATSSIYRMKTDGTQKTAIVKGNNFIMYLRVVGDCIYYSENDALNGKEIIYKVKTDGTQNTEITSIPTGIITKMNVVDGWIYYETNNADKLFKNTDTKYSIYKMKIDGTQNTELINYKDIIKSLNVVDGWIYYEEKSEKNIDQDSIYRMKTDGTQNTELISYKHGIDYLNVVDGWIYYTSYNIDNSNLDNSKHIMYRMKIDGTQNTEVTNGSIYNLNVVGDWIYYIKGNEILYKIKTDGSQNCEV